MPTNRLRELGVVVLLSAAGHTGSTPFDLRITDSRGAEVVVAGVAIDYGGLLSADKEARGIRVEQGDGLVLLKWSDLDTLNVTKRDEAVKPARVELEIILRNHRRVPATLSRTGRMLLVGRTDLGDYTIDLDKIRRIVPVR